MKYYFAFLVLFVVGCVDAASSVPKIQHWTSSKGATVLLVETHENPMLDVQVAFHAGSARDAKHPGLAMLFSRLLDKGTPTLTAEAIAAQFEDVGALYAANVDRDKLWVSLRVLSQKQYVTPSIELLAKLLANNQFSQDMLKLEQDQLLVALKQHQQRPNIVASIAFFKALYGEHPYGHPVFGTEAGISAINHAILLQFHQQYCVAKNAVITFVGDISKAMAVKVADQLMQGLEVGVLADAIPPVTPLEKSASVTLPFTSEQTHVMLGQPCLTVTDPDTFALSIGNDILGGSPLNSRLFKEVRDDRGLVYSVTSNFLQYQQPAPFVVQLQTKNSQAQEAIKVARETMRKFIEVGPEVQEVEDAKQGLIRAFPLQINNNGNILEMVSTIGFYGLPWDYLETYPQKISAVNSEAVRAVFQRRLNPNTMALIQVGSPAH